MSHMTLDADLKEKLAKVPMPAGEVLKLLEAQLFSVCSTNHLPDTDQALRVYVQHLKGFDGRALKKAIPAAAGSAANGFLPSLHDVLEEVRVTWSSMLGRARTRAEAVQLQRDRERADKDAPTKLALLVREATEAMGRK